MKRVTFEQLKETSFQMSFSKNSLPLGNVMDLKIYGKNTIYFNKKKVVLTDNDVLNIQTAKILFFLHDAEKVKKSFGGCYTKNNEIVPRFVNETADFEQRFEAILAENNIPLLIQE